MAIHVALNHVTHYKYDRLVRLSPQVIRLRPAPHARTPILAYSLRVSPQPHFLNWQQDPQSNWQARVVFPEPVREFRVEVDLVAEMSVINPFDFFLDEEAQEFPFRYDPVLEHELAPFHKKIEPGPLLKEFLGGINRSKQRTIDFLVGLNSQVKDHINYTIRMEPGVQTPEETLERRLGSCRDTAWLMVQCLRHMGLAARFVSGYLIQLVADQKPVDGPAGPEKDFTDLHAWTEVFLPGAGWVGLDATSGLLTAEGHIPVAATPEPASAAPITGGVEKCETQFHFSMGLHRVYESPRVTKPYTDAQWQAINELGREVDTELVERDVRLTMGGEPTFISATDMDGPEWNTIALSPKKRELGGKLLRRLRERYAPGGFLHFGQGKWYPGEQLPRWSFGCYWRADGQPVWEDMGLIADEEVENTLTTADAGSFIEALAARLDLDPARVIPAYEDAHYFLWRERRLPENVTTEESKVDNAMERARIARVFEDGFADPVGFVLPLERWAEREKRKDGTVEEKLFWVTGPWPIRATKLALLEGDSPIGYRLPLGQLPHVNPSDYPYINERDPTEKRDALPDYAGLRRGGSGQGEPIGKTLDSEEARDIVRTALCAQARDGIVYLFMPPMRTADDYIELVAAIEDTAKATGMQVNVEGYTPPSDYRLHNFAVTPDPGVIEVNLHPSASWDELVDKTAVLYEETRQMKLGTEKFMIDGRHTGTGGGNHVILGGATPLDSPILRRPDLLKSLLTYWHNHPSLSYLFSGLFIGPTSQSPRVDEARNDSVYELEIAFSNTPKPGEECPPWMVDRLYRNLLVDVTGNTHRAEFCLDKLYPPEYGGRRLGLLEMRAFEMPPHERMSLTQQLLLRALVAWFWRRPQERRLSRWGNDLHDRFLLPHFVHADFADVIEDLREAGYPFEPEWFSPHFEFRFPLYGEIVRQSIKLELRHALECWNVLGEQSGSATIRLVDSSVERVQVKVSGMTAGRHIITCNNRRVPLTPTGRAGEFVAGVRYRAWRQGECLHPTIGAHAPLVLDVLDTWNGRSIGGCTYHVSHPGGRSYDTFPVNGYEAESRRIARFFPFGHTPGDLKLPPEERNDEFPHTLDLRLNPEG